MAGQRRTGAPENDAAQDSRAKAGTLTPGPGLSVTGPDQIVVTSGAGLTVAQLWDWLSGGRDLSSLLDWAPDVAALTGALLERSQAFRFVVSPPAGAQWPPRGDRPFSAAVAEAAAQWRALMDTGAGAPELVAGWWATVIDKVDTPVDELSAGRPWDLCEALLAVHAIADEASAGCASARPGAGLGSTHRARARELLARTGSMARLPADRVAQLPKIRTTPVGMTHRSLSRYGCTSTDGVRAIWHRAPIRRPGTEPLARHANVLLLPWPLRIRETDFVPVPGSVHRPEREPFGYFTYEPSEPLDLDLVDRLLDEALDEVDSVDVVIMPEGRLEEQDIPGLEALLARRGVALLVAGIRADPAAATGGFGGNGVHIGVMLGGRWFHYRQHKHHRWFLDASQIQQYNIAGALHPSVKWWESMEIPQRSVNFVELGGGITLAAVVCEDLARLDGVSELIRSVGPTLVVTLLLDGPQLASRWTARYAGVLADDPGSAVLTLTAYGMTMRSQPRGRPPSPVIAMWKDPLRGLQEIPLDRGSQGVLLKAVVGRSARYAADGRAPNDDATDLYVAGVHQLQAKAGGSAPAEGLPELRAPFLDTVELTILSSWAEAVVDAIADRTRSAATATAGGERQAAMLGAVEQVLEQAGPGAAWRSATALPQPGERLAAALDHLGDLARAAVRESSGGGVAETLAAVEALPHDEVGAGRVAFSRLRAALDAARTS